MCQQRFHCIPCKKCRWIPEQQVKEKKKGLHTGMCVYVLVYIALKLCAKLTKLKACRNFPTGKGGQQESQKSLNSLS